MSFSETSRVSCRLLPRYFHVLMLLPTNIISLSLKVYVARTHLSWSRVGNVSDTRAGHVSCVFLRICDVSFQRCRARAT